MLSKRRTSGGYEERPKTLKLTNEEFDGGGIQVLSRAASILRALEGETLGLTLMQITARVGLARSTAQRIIDALSAEQFLSPASTSSGIKIGPGLHRLAASAALEFDELSHPCLAKFSHTIGETVDLSSLKGDVAVFTGQIQGLHHWRAVSGVGESFPLHCTANGKALLSVLSDAQLGKFLSRPLQAYTKATIVERDKLESQIRDCRKTGVAFDHDEHTSGISAIGTAFRDRRGSPVAISVPMPTIRFRRVRYSITNCLLHARREIQKVL